MLVEPLPTSQDVPLAVGQALTIHVTLETFDAAASGWDVRFRARKVMRGDVLIEKDGSSGIAYVGTLSEASWDVALTADDTDGLQPGERPWSFWNVSAGEENPMAVGALVVYATAEYPQPPP